jgi:hypothetical protein
VTALLIAALVATTPAGGKPDDICSHVSAFHMTKFGDSAEPKGRRWIELHWVGHWMDFDRGWGFKCRHSSDAASSALCDWIVQNVSYEFKDMTPKRILTCYGYKFPGAQWGNWKSDIDILDHDRWLKLEIDFETLAGDKEKGAIRLSSFAKDQDDALVELPPIAPVSLR